MWRYRLIPTFFFALALIGGLIVAHAQSPQIVDGCVYNAAGVTLTDQQRGAVQCNASGQLLTSVAAPQVASYSAAALSVTMALTATDVFCISGSATKTVAIKAMQLTAIATAATTTDLLITKRSALNTGGTSVADTAVPMDSNNAAATATVYHYTANPAALGTAVGNVHADKYSFAAATGAPSNTLIPYTFTPDIFTQPLILRGTAQSACFDMNGITPAGTVFSADIYWTEQ